MDDDIRPSVLFRTEAPTPEDYREAAAEMAAAAKQIETGDYSYGCAICCDSGHDSRQCHHNVLLAARSWAAATRVYVCYHCGFTASTDAEARAHFGMTDQDPPICLTSEGQP